MLASKPVLVSAKRSVKGKFSKKNHTNKNNKNREIKTFMHIDNLANTLQTTSNSTEIKYFILKYFVRINLLADYNL